MSWSQTAPGEWRAPLDSHEQLHATIPASSLPLKREHFSITVVAGLHTQGFSPEKLKQSMLSAWIALRFEHPAIAARLDAAAGEKVYTTPRPDTTDLQEWVKQTFVVIDDSTATLQTPTHDPSARTSYDLFANFEPHELPTLYFLQSASEVIYHSSHWRTDGFGVLMLLGRFFKLTCSSLDLSLLPWGEEVSQLHPSVESLLGIPADVSPLAQDLVNKRISRLVSSMPSAGVSYQGDNNALPEGTRQASLTFSAASTKAFVAACKAAGLTVSVAVNAASVRATFAYEGNSSITTNRNAYASAVPTSLRYLLAPPYDGPAYASTLAITGHGIIVPRGLSFMATALALTTQYQNDMVSSEFLAGARTWAQAFRGLVLATPPADWPPPSEIGNSSLGIVERHLPSEFANENGTETISITAFRMGVEEMTRQPELHVWTFRGQLTLSITYNEAFYNKPPLIHDLLKTIQQELEQGLGTDLDAC